MSIVCEIIGSLVVAWHGIDSSPADIESKMKMTPFAESEKFILVFPEAKNKGSGSLLSPVCFNGASCCKDDSTFAGYFSFCFFFNALPRSRCEFFHLYQEQVGFGWMRSTFPSVFLGLQQWGVHDSSNCL